MKKVVSVLLCIALIAAAICAVVFKRDANTAAADLAAANETAATAQTALATAQSDLETAQADLATATADLESIQAELAAAQEQIASLEAAVAEADTSALEAEVTRLQGAYDMQKSYVAKLEGRASELLVAQATIDTLNAEIASLKEGETETADTSALEAEVARLQGAYDMQKSYVAKLEERASELLVAQATIDSLNAKIASLEGADE